MLISRPQNSDKDIIYSLIQDCKEDMIRQGIFQWDDYYPNKEIIEQDLENRCIFVARDNKNKITGVISFDENQSEEYKQVNWKHKDSIIVIHRLAVSPTLQGRGIARGLMKYCEESSRQQGYISVRLDTYSGNERAVNFYKKLGYEYRGEVWFPRRNLPFFSMEKNLL